MTIVTIIDNSNKDNSAWWGDLTWPMRCCDIWDTDYNFYNWEPEFMTIFVIWQLIVTLDSIPNSCDVFITFITHPSDRQERWQKASGFSRQSFLCPLPMQGSISRLCRMMVMVVVLSSLPSILNHLIRFHRLYHTYYPYHRWVSG